MREDATLFTKEYQLKFICHLATDAQFMDDTLGSVRPSDFDQNAYRLVYEVARKIYERDLTLPTVATIAEEITAAMGSNVPMYDTFITPDEHDSLGLALETLAMYQGGEIVMEPEYFRGNMREYLAAARLSDLSAQMMSPGARVAATADLQRELDLTAGKEIEIVYGLTEVKEEEKLVQIPTGILALDKLTAGGPAVGTINLVVACSGVGKTTIQINMMCNDAIDERYSLFLTLEMAEQRIRTRVQSILANIPAELYKKKFSQWPSEYQKLWKYVGAPDFPLRYSTAIVDYSNEGCTLQNIEQAVIKWKRSTEALGLDPGKCKTVYIDWLDRMDITGVRGVTKNTNEERIWRSILEQIRERMARQGCVGWTATQATRDADGKEVLMKNHTAHGVHKHDPCDIGCGLAPVLDPDAEEDEDETAFQSIDDDDESDPVCERYLMLSMMKTREVNALGKARRVWQGHTLRLWPDKSDDDIARRLVEKGDYDALFGSYHLKRRIKK